MKTSTRATRKAMAGASSTNAEREVWLFDPASEQRDHHDIPVLCPSHAGRAQVRAGGRPPRRDAAAPRGPQRGPGRARQAAHASRCGKARCASTGAADGVRHRQGQWLADGGSLVAISDASGEERIEVFDAAATRARCGWDIGRVHTMRAAPRGGGSQSANHRNEVLIGDVGERRVHLVDRSDAGRSRDLAWSPGRRVARLRVLDHLRHRRHQAARHCGARPARW